MSVNVPVILNLLNKHLQNKIDFNDRKYDKFHPSEFHECSRRIAYKFYGAPRSNHRKTSYELQRVFDNGHYFHDRYTKYFEELGILKGVWKCGNPLCEKEYGREDRLGIFKPNISCECGCNKYSYEEIEIVDEEYWFSGRADGILHVAGSDAVIDYKSMHSIQFRQLKSPLSKHIIQVGIYAHTLGLDTAFLLYENKDDHKLKVYEIEVDDKLTESILSRAKNLIQTIGRGNLPARPYEKDSKQCKACMFKTLCWKDK